jgi:hypothetical protein
MASIRIIYKGNSCRKKVNEWAGAGNHPLSKKRCGKDNIQYQLG